MTSVAVPVAEEPPGPSPAGAEPGGPSRTGALLTIAGLTVASALLWFWHIGTKSLFHDEAFTASTVMRSWRSFWDLTFRTETNGALHAALLKAWTTFGDSEAALRSFSAFSLVLLVPVVAAIGWRLASANVGILASALLVVNGSVAAYAQNTRTYGLAMLLAGVATLFFVLDVERPRTLTLVGWVVSIILLTYAFLIGVLLVLAHAASIWFLPPERRHTKRRLVAAGVVVAAALPLYLLVSSHNEGQELAKFHAGIFRDVLYTVTGRAGIIGLVAAAVMGILGLRVSVRTWKAGWHSQESWVQAMLLIWSVLPLVLLSITSPVRTMLIGRYLLFCVPGMLLYGSIGLLDFFHGVGRWRERVPFVRVLPIVLAFAAGLYGILWWYSDGGHEDWRGAAEHVFAEARPDDRILFANDSVRLFFEYYRAREHPTTLPQPSYPPEPWGEYGTGDQTYFSFDPADVAPVAADPHGRVWVVVGRNHDNVDGVDETLRPLDGPYTVADDRLFDGDVEVILYEPA
jgi:4-amino-4-deoxy-L-arabinose transferase-like glycosyltransferase